MRREWAAPIRPDDSSEGIDADIPDAPGSNLDDRGEGGDYEGDEHAADDELLQLGRPAPSSEDVETRRSTAGYVFNVGSGVIGWSSTVILLDWILIGALDGAGLALEVVPMILLVDWSGFEAVELLELQTLYPIRMSKDR